MLYFFNFVLLLYWAPNPVHGQQFWLNFTITNVVECSPINIDFSRNITDQDLPMILTIIPFSDQPVVIPIPNLALNTSGLSVSFLPLEAGQEFVASLDGDSGLSIAQVSDVTTVMPSPTGNSSCLSPSGLSLHSSKDNNDNYKLLTTPIQCQDITVFYDTSQVLQAPIVRAFVPNGDSVVLPQTSDDPSNGTATYTLVMQRGTQFLLMFDDGQQHRETTDLLTVAGDSNTPQNCLNLNDGTAANATASASGSPQGDTQGSTGIPRGVIIGCSAGGAVIVIIAISMIVFVIRDRQLRRRRLGMSLLHPQDSRRIPPVPGLPPPRPPRYANSLILTQGTARSPFEEVPDIESGGKGGSYITNPPYVMRELEGGDDGRAPLDRRSFSSWTNNDELSPREPSMHRRPSVDPVQVLDIEDMLNRATALSGTHIMKQAMGNEEDDTPKSLRSRDSYSTIKSLGIPRLGAQTNLSRMQARHQREPSDVPADLTGSGTLSGFSMHMSNPFTDGPVELPSPFNRTDEPARPASDTLRPISLERKEGREGKVSNQELVKGDERNRVIGSREEN